MLPIAILGTGAALAYSYSRGPANLIRVTSKQDGRVYSVQNLPKSNEACENLAEIRSRLMKLITMYKSEPATLSDPRISVMIERFNPDNMCENDIHSDSTSYSENKGEKIVICLRDKKPPYSLVDINTVMFVVLHEMAHLMTTTIGHTPEFWANFRRILLDAQKCGIYTIVNYAHTPVLYCGMTITDSPI